jgi:LAS superfamily LD-carboxypeptidase LdcB
MKFHLPNKFGDWPIRIVGILVLAGVAFFAAYSYRGLEAEKVRLLSDLESARSGNYELIKELQVKDGIIESFQGQLGEISNTVGTLEKLTYTDEELLKKYSKIYFLNENYVPPSLTDIDEKYLLDGSKNFMIYSKVWPYLRNLLEKSRAAKQNLLVASAYRSFDTQASLKAGYKVVYGSGANQFSADQGYSEHQLGTALDFTTPASAGALLQTSEPGYKWLLENAYKYGFILSYPPNNSYYKFEPWHWRFVGVELATKLHNEGKYFYDLDQREIDKYLVKLFD